jgi:ubiquinone biosynthesis protein Coq4
VGFQTDRMHLFPRLSKMLVAFRLFYIQDVSGGRVNILEGVSIGLCEKKMLYDHVYNSEWNRPVLSDNHKDHIAIFSHTDIRATFR